jgi:methionine synthase II (cobalamin-independent)
VTAPRRTGVGSLPHRDPDEAVRFMLASTDVPYLPQLPNRHLEESMLPQWGDGVCGAGPDPAGSGLVLGRSGPRSEAFGGAAAALTRLGPGPVKTQATGPLTLATALAAAGANRVGLIDRVVDELVARIADHLAWITSTVEGAAVTVVLDEPALVAVDAGSAEAAVVTTALRRLMEAIDADVGIHCCGDTDWALLAGLRPAWISWDVAALGPGFIVSAGELAAAIAAGTRIMWGVVPTARGPLPDRDVLLARYGTAVATLIVAGAPYRAVTAESWFSPACGMAGLAEDDAAAVVRRLDEVVEEMTDGW